MSNLKLSNHSVDEKISVLAKQVDDAAFHARAIMQLSEQGYPLSLAEAYHVQDQSLGRRLARGEQQVGIKMGFTSRAKMIQMGVDDMIWGPLTDEMFIEEGGEVALDKFIHPRVEPEIAFLLKKPLSGNVTLAEVMAAVEAVAPALEVIDSRYNNFKFSLEDVVADNCSSSGFTIGAWQQAGLDLSNLGMVMEFDGKAVQIGSSAAILGNPYRSLAAAARVAGEAGKVLPAGSIVLAGAATAAQALTPGVHVKLHCEKLGVAEFSVV
ncbi:2-keto-4-pentenoate hydratase [Thalassotalea sp. ND16A]|uniref:2-keto-4-pentenoate hydratase n=1 Tax=Thalassotalea sp. ND16A TaxID=1535422 RepID=UPI00051D8FAE|nr:fumarylacetoacetate hydrolase family protein [Thalassotalea sp. ND16A]KGJ98522.1 4-oxalocrotonate decarboxylase [Thalassotalea sp. ND16A]